MTDRDCLNKLWNMRRGFFSRIDEVYFISGTLERVCQCLPHSSSRYTTIQIRLSTKASNTNTLILAPVQWLKPIKDEHGYYL